MTTGGVGAGSGAAIISAVTGFTAAGNGAPLAVPAGLAALLEWRRRRRRELAFCNSEYSSGGSSSGCSSRACLGSAARESRWRESMLVWSPVEHLLLPLAGRSGNGALGAAVLQQQEEQIPLRFALLVMLAPHLSSVAPLFSGRALLLLQGSPHVGGHSHGAIVFAVKL